jgi:hypothetical protein
MKYTFIKNHEYLFPIEKMCKVLEVGSSGYYKWKSYSIFGKKQDCKIPSTDVKKKFLSF